MAKTVEAPNPAVVLQEMAAAKVRRFLARQTARSCAQVIMSAGNETQRREAGALLLALVSAD